MEPTEYALLWRDYVAAFAELVDPASRDPTFPAAQRLVGALRKPARFATALQIVPQSEPRPCA